MVNTYVIPAAALIILEQAMRASPDVVPGMIQAALILVRPLEAPATTPKPASH